MATRRYSADDLRPGLKLSVHNQGRNITPQTRTVTVYWVGPNDVHYTLDEGKQIRNTTIYRFLEIINDSAIDT